MADVSFLPAAENEYREALAWYEARSAQASAGFEAAVAVAVRAIGEHPGRWPLCDDRHRYYTLRRYPFSIIYRQDAGAVVVVAVAHSRRSAAYWQNRD